MLRCPVETGETEILVEFCARTLAPGRAAALEEHLAQCESCRRFCEAQQVVWSALEEWEAEPVSPDFDQRLYRRIAADKQPGLWERWLESWGGSSSRRAVPALAALCLFAAGSLLLPPQGAVPLPVVDSASVREVELIESTLDDLDMIRDFSSAIRPEGAQSL